MKYAHPVSKKLLGLLAPFFLKIYRVPIGCFVIKSVSRKLGSNLAKNNHYYTSATSGRLDISFPPRQHNPRNPGQLVGQGNCNFIGMHAVAAW
jgi:hypothetical protein